ncbi:hypothetical protein HDE79_001296 [Rhodanobacter sp. MP1X3]|nr:hypothetical protein [Rhodanobacter sp. MP1X3]
MPERSRSCGNAALDAMAGGWQALLILWSPACPIVRSPNWFNACPNYAC